MSEEKEAPKIYKAIAAIIADMKAIGKDGRNEQQRFDFRSIEAVCNEVHALLAKHGVFFAPTITGEIRVTDAVNAKGNKYVHVILRVKYTFFADDGSFIGIEVPGEAADYADKACSKAMTFAEKTALCQLFCIPPQPVSLDDRNSPDMNGGSAPASRAEDFLKNKAKGKQPSPKASAKPGVAFFRSVASDLAKRDLMANMVLSDADYSQIGQSAVAICQAKGSKAVGEWLKAKGRLAFIEGANGEIAGIAVTEITDAA